MEHEKKYSALLWMVCFYLFLTIERPWESISYLHDMRIERIFAVIVLIVAFFCGKLRLRGVVTDKWVLALLALHFVLAPFAYLPLAAFDQAMEYAKMVALYVLITSCCEDEADLRLVVKLFVGTMAVYVLHSFWEYHNGRHTFRMGIVRMLGVGSTFSDPNTFAASIVLSIPFAWTVLKAETGKWMRRGFVAYGLLGGVCVILTGSRSGMLALLVLISLLVIAQKGARRWKLTAIMGVVIMMVWYLMPSDKQERLRSVWDEDAGPANAHESARGRILGYQAGLKMFFRKPVTGIGAGGENFIAFRKDNVDGGLEQAHNLIGEVLGELGLCGAIAFLGLIGSSSVLLWKTRQMQWQREGEETYLFSLAGAGLVTLLLLIVQGLAGHNFYRPMWLWLAAWASLVHVFAERRVTQRQEECEGSRSASLASDGCNNASCNK